VGVAFYQQVEHFSFVDSFYFTVITLTTVGYGDLYPVTEVGKIFTAFYVLVGLGVIASFITVSADRLVERGARRREEKLAKKSKGE